MAAASDAAAPAARATRNLLAIATEAVAGRDRDTLALNACEQVAAALDAPWAALAHLDTAGALVATIATEPMRRGTVLADPDAVASAGLLGADEPARVPSTAATGRHLLDAVALNPRRADAGVLVVARPDRGDDMAADEAADYLVRVAALLGAAFERIRLDAEVALNEQRLAEAQELARLGSYDWHIPTDTNTWSDELYRIYGYEPGAFNASYERFLSMIHPDDRERIVAIHTKAMQDHQPYRMEERVVRPDGEIRILDSTGKVVLDEQGHPLRMVGICLDVTEQRQAAEALRRSQERFRNLVESSPDAVILFDDDGVILQANRETEVLFRWPPEELVGKPVQTLLPDEVRRPAAVGLELLGRRRDGGIVAIDVSLARIDTDHGLATAAFVRDATARKRAAEADRWLARAEERRRQALEINDNVVQGLAAVVGSLEMGWPDQALQGARATLAAARAMMSELLDDRRDELAPGDLVRAEAAPAQLHAAAPPRSVTGLRADAGPHAGTEPHAPVSAEPDAAGTPGTPGTPDDDGAAGAAQTATPPEARPLSVLLADDSADLRALYRLMLRRHGIQVVAEAAGGLEAVRLAKQHRPDIALLDLAMPGLDGLQVTAQLKRELPECRVVILSGFEEARVGEQARAAGADYYLTKGVDGDALAETLFAIGPPRAQAEQPQPEPAAIDLGEELLHELRTPLTVIDGAAATLLDQMDQVDRDEQREMLEMIVRNADHLAALIESYGDLRRLDAGRLALAAQPVDLAGLVADSVEALRRLLIGRPVQIHAGEPVVARADPLRVRQILVNLLSNAVKFGTPGTPIVVELARAEGMARVRVRNSGPVIAAADRAQLFRPFERLGARGKGAGLGLSISRGLAEAHGGALELADDADDGLTTFELRLPAG